MKSIVHVTIGAAGGLLIAYFANPRSEPDANLGAPAHSDIEQFQARGSLRSPALAKSHRAIFRRDPRADGGAAGGEREIDRVSVPLGFFDEIDVQGFTSETRSPWAAETEAFVISEELRELLKLEKAHTEAIQDIFIDAREKYMSPQWSRPTAIRERSDGVVIEIAPAPTDLEALIRDSLVSVIGERRTLFLMEKVAPTLDWEFGGFGRARRVIEVSMLPDDTISLRESLRRADPGGHSNGRANEPDLNGGQFELRTRQYRVDRLPEPIAGLVIIEPVNGGG